VTYNRLFEAFYDNDEDQVRGLIAYGLYKIAKREWSRDFAQRNGRAPNEAELEAYHASWTPAVVSGKQSEAEQVLKAYSDEVIKLERPRIVEEALRGTTGAAIRTNPLSNFIYTLLLVGVVVILEMAGVDILSIAQAS